MSATPKNANDLIDHLIADESFAAELASLQSKEAIQTFLHSKGYDFSWDDFGRTLSERLKKLAPESLSDEALGLVSGGNFIDFATELYPHLFRNFVHFTGNIAKKVGGDIHDAANSGLNAAQNSSSLQNFGKNMSRARNPFAG